MVQGRLILAAAVAAVPAFALAADGLDAAIGKALFERNWVSAPSSTRSDDGLGPLYDAPSCSSCHLQRPLAELDDDTVPPGTVIRLGNAKGEGDPIYGRQLQTRGVAGQMPEANPDIAWRRGTRGHWTAAIKLYSQHYGPLAASTKMGLRRAPVLNGAGLLEQVPESEVLAAAKAQRARKDGIAGQPAYITVDGKRMLGRFGWKATEPDLASQISTAFSRDIGMSTTRHPEPYGDCTKYQTACIAGPHGARPGDVEISDMLVDAIAKYLKSLKPSGPGNEAGDSVFKRIGCDACHAMLHLSDGAPVRAYTDLLLHDLGPSLGDGIKEGMAEPDRWRTAPLWNTAENLKVGRLLHDGRARNVDEAVRWHAGEAANARLRYLGLTSAERAALVAFVSGL